MSYLSSRLTLLVLPLLLTSIAAQAQPRDTGHHLFSYSYGQLGYENWDYDDGLDVDALVGDFSLALDANMFARAKLAFYDGDDHRRRHKRSTDGHRVSVGLGYHTPIAQGLDLVTTGDVIRDHHDHGSKFGFALQAGVRHATAPRLELSGGLFYEDLYENELGVYGQALFHVSTPFDVGARFQLSGDINHFGLFARYNFF